LSQVENLNVTLIDKGAAAGENTSLAASLFTLARSKSHHIPLVQETYRAIQQLESQLGEKLGTVALGTVHLASDPTTEKALEHVLSNCDEFSIQHRNAAKDDLKKWFPWLNHDLVSEAAFFPQDIYVDSVVLTQAYVAAARQNGAKIRFNTHVTDVELEGDQVVAVNTPFERIECDAVVDAAGVWSNLLSVRHGIHLPMAPVRSIYWITEKNEGLFPKHQPVCIIPEAKTYTRPESGALLFGIRDTRGVAVNPTKLGPSVHQLQLTDTEEIFEILSSDGKRLLDFFPELANTGIQHVVSGLSTYTIDGEFIIGESDRINGFFAATGCSGAGVATSGGFGRLIAEMIAGIPLYTDASKFDPNRTPEINPFSDEFVSACANVRSGKRDG
jgi:4-methylaminobutanoate oxidase (formaldehyde-forming)